MDWTNPERGVWLWLIPALVGFWVWAFLRRKRALEQFSHPVLLPQLTGQVNWPARWLKTGIVTLGCFFLLVALVGPQWGFRWKEIKRRGIDIVIAVDVSNSMLAEDVKPNRLERAKSTIRDLLQVLKGERVGLIAFAGTSFVQCPLTMDYGAFSLALNELTTQTIPRGGTALAQVIQYSLTAFAASVPEARALILISDGESHVGDALAAAKEVGEAGVKIYSVGFGTPEGEPIPLTDKYGQRTFLKDRTGRTVTSRLDETALQQVALAAGGAYVRNTETSSWLDFIYHEHIATLEPQEVEGPMKKQPVLRFQWALAVALILLSLEPFLSDRKRGTA